MSLSQKCFSLLQNKCPWTGGLDKVLSREPWWWRTLNGTIYIFFLCYGLAHSCHNSTIVVFLPEVLLCICPESCPQREPRGCAAAVHTVPSSARGCSKAGSTHLLEREVWGRSVAATTQTPWSYRTWRWHQSSSLTAYNHIADTSPL